jgi:hypothetical protein
MNSTKVQELRERCAAVDRLVDRTAAAQAEAAANRLAHPDSTEAWWDFEAAEERYCLAKDGQRRARRALHRAELRHAALWYLFAVLTAGRSTRRPMH